VARMNWDRVRTDNLMAAAAHEDRLASAAGNPPRRMWDGLDNQRIRLEPVAAPARRGSKSSLRQRVPRTAPQITTLRSQITEMRRKGNRRATETLARRGLTLLTNIGSNNLRPDRAFFREALEWSATATATKAAARVGSSAIMGPASTKRSAKKKSGVKQKAATKARLQRQEPRPPNARQKQTSSDSTSPLPRSRAGKGDRRQQQFRRRLRFLGELRTAVTAVGGSVVVSTGGLVEVKGPTGSVKFSTGNLSSTKRARYEIRRRIEHSAGLDLEMLNWSEPAA
jgi:hypothetical protein